MSNLELNFNSSTFITLAIQFLKNIGSRYFYGSRDPHTAVLFDKHKKIKTKYRQKSYVIGYVS